MRQASLASFQHPLIPSKYNGAYFRSFGERNSKKVNRCYQLSRQAQAGAGLNETIQSRSLGPSLDKAEEYILVRELLEKFDEIPPLQLNAEKKSKQQILRLKR